MTAELGGRLERKKYIILKILAIYLRLIFELKRSVQTQLNTNNNDMQMNIS